MLISICKQGYINRILEEIRHTRMWNILNKLEYKFRRSKSGEQYLDLSKEMHQWRLDSISTLNKLKSEGFLPIYLDETYVNEHHVYQFGWFRKGLKIKKKCGKGQRYILFHAGGERGWVRWKPKLFVGKSKSSDYHDSINSQHFF